MHVMHFIKKESILSVLRNGSNSGFWISDKEIDPRKWPGGSKNLDYFQSAADTQIVGRAIAYMFNNLRMNGFRNQSFK